MRLTVFSIKTFVVAFEFQLCIISFVYYLCSPSLLLMLWKDNIVISIKLFWCPSLLDYFKHKSMAFEKHCGFDQQKPLGTRILFLSSPRFRVSTLVLRPSCYFMLSLRARYKSGSQPLSLGMWS